MNNDCIRCVSLRKQIDMLVALRDESRTASVDGVTGVVGGYHKTSNYVMEMATETISFLKDKIGKHLLTHEELPE